MICGTPGNHSGWLWDPAVRTPGGPTGTNDALAPFEDILPVIHTLYVLLQEVL